MSFKKKQLTVDSVTWTPVIVSQDSNYLTIRNPSAVVCKIRTVVTDPTTEDTIAPSMQEIIGTPPDVPLGVGQRWRFFKGDIVANLQSASGAITVIVTEL